MKEQGTKITKNTAQGSKIAFVIEEVIGICMEVKNLLHGKEQGGTDLWLQLVKDCQRVHLNFHIELRGRSLWHSLHWMVEWPSPKDTRSTG